MVWRHTGARHRSPPAAGAGISDGNCGARDARCRAVSQRGGGHTDGSLRHVRLSRGRLHYRHIVGRKIVAILPAACRRRRRQHHRGRRIDYRQRGPGVRDVDGAAAAQYAGCARCGPRRTHGAAAAACGARRCERV